MQERNKTTDAKQIKNRVHTVTFTILVALLIALFFYLCIFSLRIIKNSTTNHYEGDCIHLADAYSYAFSELIDKYLSDLKSFSSSDIFKYGTKKEINLWIRRHDDRRPSYFLNFFYADKSGNLISSTGLSANISDRVYFKKIVYDGCETAVDDGSISRTTGKFVLHVARAVYNNKKELIGLIGGAVELTTFQKIVSNIKIGKSGYAFIINSNGEFISYPDKRMLLRKNNSSVTLNSENTVEYMLKHQSGYVKAVSITGVPVSIAFEPIKNTPCILGISIPDSEVQDLYNSVREAQIYVFLIMILGILVSLSVEMFVLHALSIKLNKEADYDKLTTLLSQTKFEQLSEQLIVKNSQSEFIFIDADIRGFKVLNQTYGTEKTDAMLILFSNALKHAVEKYTGYICRGYADRFYGLFIIEDQHHAMNIFRSKLKEISREIKKSDIVFYIKFGIVFSKKNEENISVQALTGKASFAKSTIRNNLLYQYAAFTPEMQLQINEEREIESRMEKALADKEFFVIYQPKISLKTEKIIGAEALVRWNNPKFGIMPPSKFIPTFEKNGFIVNLDFYVYDQVFQFIQKQLDEHKPVVPISMNMSRNHTNPERFMSRFNAIFKKYTIPPFLVEIEIIERTSETGKLMLLETTKLLHKHGFNVAMDDFGSGESSLNMLNTIPVDILKFDQTFLNPNNYTEKTSGLITKLVELGKQLDKKTVFEGVETKEQIDFLKSIQCDQVQGFYYSRPLKEDDFLRYIAEHI
jgi:EAL domain-containing protein (putative c-di-GMP-specific phosphodiesterase class I)/GGDEF domain-containing protein